MYRNREHRESYGREKIIEAVHLLATSDGSIQLRLAEAARYLTRVTSASELPTEYRAEFNGILRELTKEQATSNEDNIAATTSSLTAEQGTALAERIFTLYTKLEDNV